jgi:hypothetical protein
MKVRPRRKSDLLRFLVLVLLALGIWAVIRTLLAPAYDRPRLGSRVNCAIAVTYAGPWQGTYGDVHGVTAWSGTGWQVVELSRAEPPVSAKAKKMDGSNRELTVAIQRDGAVVASAKTASPYGAAEVVWTGAGEKPQQGKSESRLSGLVRAIRGSKSRTAR